VNIAARTRARWLVFLASGFIVALLMHTVDHCMPAQAAAAPPPTKKPAEKPKQFEGNKPEPVSQTKDGSLTLPASKCEVFGKTLGYMKEDRALGYWNSADDRAAWTLDVAKPGKFEVWFEWSCADDSAGNTFLLEIGKNQVKGKVPSTKKWEKHEKAKFGEIDVPAGKSRLEISAVGKITEALYDLREVRLVPVKK